jgi:ammonium transporter Rh
MGKYKKESTILAFILIATEVLILFMYGFFIRVSIPSSDGLVGYFPWLQDVVVMILIGFGYLMTFIKNYGWSALGYTFLITAVGVQHYLLWEGFWKMVFVDGHEAGHVISVGMPQMIQAFFAVGSCLISTGALLGRTHPLDLIIMVILEMIPYTLVEILIFNVLALQDAGGSMNIHMFGAYFGLAVSTVIGRRHSYGDNLPSVSKISGMFSMIGTLFLWIYWPSFNSALISPTMVY